MSDALRDEVLELLRGPHAHATFEEALEEFPAALQGKKPTGAPHTAWELLEHMRRAQVDILEFCRNSEYESLEFPAGYWPASAAPPDAGAWGHSVTGFLKDRRELEKMVAEAGKDLLRSVPDEEGPSLLHEIFIVAAHNSYHVGQILFLRRMLGA